MGFKVKQTIDESLKNVVVIDFETTGLKAGYDRVIEVGVVKLQDNKIVDQVQQLMKPEGVIISSEISTMTGITEDMLEGQPTPEEVMPKLHEFIGDAILIAHNANFDKRFLEAELSMVGLGIKNPWLCTLMMGRRFAPNSENHKLNTLINYYDIRIGNAHRALNDVLMTAQLWVKFQDIFKANSGINPTLDLFTKFQKVKKTDVKKWLGGLR